MENGGFEDDAGGGKGPLESTSVDMGEKPADKPYPGMGKEDLLRFSQTPFWNRLRFSCLVVFWLGWAALLAAVVGLTVVAPRCEAPPDQTWWQKTVAYQVFLRSFYDTDGDGIGDIRGVTQKLDHLESLNVEAVMVSAFYPSHLDETDRDSDFGYDVTNHTAIDPVYGDLNDFKDLLEEAHERDMKVIIDFIPNHTGDKHPWFNASASSPEPTANPYWNYYVWTDCGNTPNWLSVYNGSAWVADRGGGRPDECYLNQFLHRNTTPEVHMPDLNLRSSAVRQELERILRYWLDIGVDGFRVMNVNFLFEDGDLANEGVTCTDADADDYNCRDHSRTTGQDENFDILSNWRHILNEYSTDYDRILVTDARDSVNNTLRYYGNTGLDGAHLPLNFQFLSQEGASVAATPSGEDVKDKVDAILANKPSFATPTWMTGYQDDLRAQLPAALSPALAVLELTLPGAGMLYYGQEIGMTDGAPATGNSFKDPTGLSRERMRTPMQWDDSENGGFSNGTAWVHVNPDYVYRNVENATEEAGSLLHLYTELAELHRQEDGLAYGALDYAVVDAEVFSFIRHYDGTTRFLVAINLSPEEQERDFSASLSKIPGSADLVLSTAGTSGSSVGLRRLKLRPNEALVASWAYSR